MLGVLCLAHGRERFDNVRPCGSLGRIGAGTQHRPGDLTIVRVVSLVHDLEDAPKLGAD
jgi:hypothetical protein